jgi:hypothetical protein
MALNNLIKVVSVSAGISCAALLGVWFWHQSPNPAQHAKSSTFASVSASASESQLEASSGSVVSRTEVFAMEFSTWVAASNGQLLTSFELSGPFTMTGFHSGKQYAFTVPEGSESPRAEASGRFGELRLDS